MPDFLLRWTVRLAFACYVATLVVRISKVPTRRNFNLSRLLWAAGCVLFLVHVWAAFQFVHHWSHDDAWRETARQTQHLTGFQSGAGLWLNYLFAAVWLFDVGRLWTGNHDGFRPRSCIDIAIQAFFALMWFNATVVFGAGLARWMGIAGGVLLTGAYAMSRVTSSASTARPRS